MEATFMDPIKKMPLKMGFAFEKQPKPRNYQTTINRFKPLKKSNNVY
jgi:hypothetical protein